MKFLAIEKENVNSPGHFTGELLMEEARKVHELYLSGMLREIWFNDDHCAVLMLECESRQISEDILSDMH